ncbi:aminotransferase class IV [Jidongwangia harbinensis]|uniref:aminotransferase class IV n=1 Tax=Jidongwangia harbinensis TaxID=2878561 RepID=UPI001CDA3F6C|nr:aminotransferase class IV [Jidongwangia harbinensis]MCA2218782.1 aminotransferase class IV [Jidongwangia harbinensis]
MLIVELNGRAPGPAEWHRAATAPYGHFTSMQVRDGRVRGMALHLARLDDGNAAFFGRRGDVDEELRLRGLIRHALGDVRDASVRVSFVASDTDRPDVLVAVSDPGDDRPGPPLRVRTDVYEREWPEQKHVSTMGLRYAQRRARTYSFDDALFVGRDQLIREGSMWNVAFWDGEQVVWPQAPMLKGVTMVLLQVAMTMAGTPWTMRPVRRAELPDLLAAAAVNSRCPAQPVAGIDEVAYGEHATLVKVLNGAWATVPWDEI